MTSQSQQDRLFIDCLRYMSLCSYGNYLFIRPSQPLFAINGLRAILERARDQQVVLFYTIQYVESHIFTVSSVSLHTRER